MSGYRVENLERFAEQVEHWLLECGWSQTHLAKESGISPTAISRILKTKELRLAGESISIPRHKTVKNILEALARELGPKVKRHGWQLLRGKPEGLPRAGSSRRSPAVEPASQPALPFAQEASSPRRDDGVELLQLIEALSSEQRAQVRWVIEGLREGWFADTRTLGRS